MKYTSMEGLKNYMGDEAFSAWQNAHANDEGELERCERRMLAYIIPNSPVCDNHKFAFANAVYAQIIADSKSTGDLSGVPEGIASFTVNGFSATLKDNAGDVVSSVGICRDARAELLYAGLLYRGVSVC